MHAPRELRFELDCTCMEVALLATSGGRRGSDALRHLLCRLESWSRLFDRCQRSGYDTSEPIYLLRMPEVARWIGCKALDVQKPWPRSLSAIFHLESPDNDSSDCLMMKG